MHSIFISYRRGDSAGHAGRLFDRLGATFGRHRVFMDVSAIEAGLDFVETIERAVGSCDALLAIIGRDWVDCRDPAGRRRLEDPSDFIRIEITTALDRNVRVIPVLVQGAAMPDVDVLPASLTRLTRRQAIELRDTRWDADVDALIEVLQRLRSPVPADPKEQATRPPIVEQPTVPSTVPVATSRRRRWLLVLGAAFSLLAGAVWFQFGSQMFGTSPSVPRAPSQPLPTNVKDTVSVPNLLGVNLKEAGRLLADARLELGAVDRHTTQADMPGSVIRQTPVAGTQVAPASEVAVVVASKPSPTPPVTSPPIATDVKATVSVPNLHGVNVKEAGGLIAAARLKLGAIEHQTTDAGVPDRVIRQTPVAGADVAPDTEVSIVVAARPSDRTSLPVPPNTTAPDLIGVSLDEAAGRLKAARLRLGDVTRREDAGIPGRVIGQAPPVGAVVGLGTVVSLVVAVSPALEVPLVVGQPLDRATELLRKAGFVVGSQRAEVKPGTAPFEVLTQTPFGGSRAPKGTRIDLVYAQPRLSVPDVVGLSLKDAIARLGARGFKIGRLTRVSSKAPAEQILSQSPPAESEQEAGTAIDLNYAEPLGLRAPVMQQPACGSTIDRPKTSFLQFSWDPVPGAASYTVEVDCFGCDGKRWSSASGTPWHVRPQLGKRSAIYASDLGHAPGSALRWRIWSVDEAGARGTISDWCPFTFR